LNIRITSENFDNALIDYFRFFRRKIGRCISEWFVVMKIPCEKKHFIKEQPYENYVETRRA
jgi:hypothetical protein